MKSIDDRTEEEKVEDGRQRWAKEQPHSLSRYVVRKHSGQSVFAWRVYHEWQQNGVPIWKRTQLAKCKTQEAAEAFATRLRSRR